MPDGLPQRPAHGSPSLRSNAALPVEDAERVAKSISRALRRAASRARAPVSIISGGGGFQARRGDRAFRLGIIISFALCVVAPLLVASIYWGLVASKQYVTESKFSLRSGESSPLDSALGSVNGSNLQEGQVVVNYIKGRTIVEVLDKDLNLRKIYSRPGVDYFSSFDPEDPVEELEKYWKKRVDASIDLLTGIISVSVRAFTPEDSLAIMNQIIRRCEDLVNDLSTRSRRDALNLAKTELGRAEENLKKATTAMRDARNVEGVLDAPAAAEAITKIITQLRADLASVEESLALQRSAAAADSPVMRLTEARAQSLKKQIADYTAQIADCTAQIASADAGNGETMAHRAGVLSMRQTELDLANQRYALALAAFEGARVDLETQRAYLVPFLRPTLAEKSLYPRRWIEWSIIVVPATLGWAVLLAIALVARDHMAK
ncbi:MAG: hypothetical protein N2444_05475 [Methylocystis sp.]|nr:hypothetical protein [Methylocystis sp.]